MRAARLGAAHARVTDDVRIMLTGKIRSSELSPLEEIYAPNIDALPGSIQHPIRAEFWSRLGEASEPEKHRAAAWVGKSVSDLVGASLDIAFDADIIERKAHNCARVCGYFKHLEHAEEFCRERGIEPPADTKVSTRRGRLLRTRDPRWWRRQLDKFYGRRAENGLRRAGLIHKGRQLYASDLCVAGRRQRVAINNRWVKDRVVVSDCGDQLELWDVRESSQANPTLRRNELMTRLRGFSEVATAAGHVADFYTLTTPSRFHAWLDAGGANPRFDDSCVREAQGWLRGMWAKARAKLKRLKVLIYGFRIAEPHHDGTPHWHMVLFCPSHHRDTVRNVLRGYWLSDGGGDPGALDRRITVKDINSHKGTAAGYLAKYVAKNIDGFQVGDDLEAADQTPAAESCERVTAWATRHGIRQFQQIGGPAVTVWRELRRIRTAVSVGVIESARVHADAGDWSAFVNALGGIETGRAGSVALWADITGECNDYEEMRGPQIVGIVSGTGRVKTREKVWRIEKKTAGQASEGLSPHISAVSSLRLSSLGPVSITVRGGAGTGEPSAWSNPNETSMYGPH